MISSRHVRQFALLLLAVGLLAFARPNSPPALTASLQAALYTAQYLGTLGRNNSTAFSVSNSGETVIGSSDNGGGLRERGFAWTKMGSVPGVAPPRGDDWSLMDVSGDGSTFVGGNHVGESRVHAFVWTQADGLKDLGTLGGGESYAHGISADGRTVVGSSGPNYTRQRAVRRTVKRWLQPLVRSVKPPLIALSGCLAAPRWTQRQPLLTGVLASALCKTLR